MTDSPWHAYENYDYREYFEERVRTYEDLIERIALSKVMPKNQVRLVDLGANYGRLTNCYDAQQVFLADGAFSSMVQANSLWGESGAQCLVCDIAAAPFPAGEFDVVISIRTLHHQSDIRSMFNEASRLLKPAGKFIFTYANKRNIFQVGLNKLGLGRRQVDSIEPELIGEGISNFHPAHISSLLKEYRFVELTRLGIGIFRTNALGPFFPASLMANVESLIQDFTGQRNITPSILISAEKT